MNQLEKTVLDLHKDLERNRGQRIIDYNHFILYLYYKYDCYFLFHEHAGKSLDQDLKEWANRKL